MAFILRALLALALTFASLSSFSASIWFGDDDGAHRVNTDTNRVDLTIRSVDPVALAINAADGSLWVLTANRIFKYRSDGTYQFGAFLRSFSNSMGDGLALALNPNDGSLWVAGQSRLLLLNANGELTRKIDVSTQDLSVAQDGTLWLLTRQGSIKHYGSDGALLQSVSPDGPGHGRDYYGSYGNGTYLALDDTGGVLWTADGKQLTKRSLSDPSQVLLSKRLSESVNDLSLDVQSGELWVIGDRSLFALSRAGSVILTKDLRDYSIWNPNTVVFDFASQGIWVGHQHGISRLDFDAHLIATIRGNDAVRAIAIGRAPVDVTPTLALSQPLPKALVNTAQPTIAFRYGADCSGLPCGFPNSYFSTYTLSAQLNGTQVGQLFTFNATTGLASLTPPSPLPQGVNEISGQVTDSFGRQSDTVTAQFSVDSIAPLFANVTPATGSVFTAPQITIQGNVDDATATVRLAGVSAPAGTSFSFPVTLNAGVNNFSLTATDLAGNVTTLPLAYTYNPPNNPPIVAISSPADGASFTAPASVTVTASASDPGGSVASVEFFSNGNSLGVRTGLPYSVSLTGLAAGNYTFTAKATDNLGASTTSAPVNISVTTPNNPPTVAITSPSGGAVFTAPATIVVKATASDSDGTIDHVDFLLNGVVAGTVTSAPFNFTLTNVPAGAQALTARAVDNLGASVTSAPVNVTVNALTLAIASPANGAAVDGDTVLVTGSFGAPANSGVVVNDVVAALVGNTFYALVPVSAGSNTLSAVLTAPEGQTQSASVSVSATGAVPTISVSADPLSGLAPLTVTFTVTNPTDQDASFTFDPYGTFSAPAGTSLALSLNYPAGVFVATFIVTGAGGATSTQSFVIESRDAGQMDQMFKALWSGFTGALMAGNKATAMNYLSTSAQAKYGPVFDALATDFAQIIPTWSPLLKSSILGSVGEYGVVTSNAGVRRLFLIYFVRGTDGVWRVDSM